MILSISVHRLIARSDVLTAVPLEAPTAPRVCGVAKISCLGLLRSIKTVFRPRRAAASAIVR